MITPISKKILKFIDGVSIDSHTSLSEEQLYEMVGKEIAEGDIKDGLWTKAKSKAMGDEVKIEPLYIKYRVQNIKDEADVKENFLVEEEKQRIYNEKNSEVNINNKMTKVVGSLLGRVRGTSFFIGIVGLLSIGVAYLMTEDSWSDPVVLPFYIIGAVSMGVAIFLYSNYETMVKRFDDFSYIKGKIFITSIVSIVVSIIMMISSIIHPVMGIIGVFIFFSVIINLIKFYSYYSKLRIKETSK